MKIRKVITISIFLIFSVIFLTSCAKLTHEEYANVEAEITDTYYRPPYVTPIMSGRAMMPIRHPATYRVTVRYEGVEYKITGRNFYKEYKDRVGETIKVVCYKRYYDDGSIEQDIKAPDNY